MRRVILTVACFGLLGLFSGTEARAQWMPNWAGPMNQMMQQNMMFDAAMAQNAQNAVMQEFLRRQRFRQATGYTGHIPSPVSPGQLSDSIGEMNEAFDDYNRGWSQNSQRQWDATGRYDMGAVRGEQVYVDLLGGPVELPYGPERTYGNGLGEYWRGGPDYDPNVEEYLDVPEMFPAW